MTTGMRAKVRPGTVTVRAYADYNAPPFPTDQVTVSDEISFSPLITTARADAVAATDSISFFTNTLSLDDAVSAVDAISSAAGYGRALADTASASDSAVTTRNLSTTIADTTSASDAFSSGNGYALAPADTATASDSISANLNAFEPEATALFARMSADPGSTRKGHINTLIAALKSAGVWSKLDVFVVLAAHDSQAARLNWVSANFSPSPVNSPTFTADRGYQFDNATSYLNTNYDPSVNGSAYTQNFAYAAAWSRTSSDVDSTNPLLATVSGSSWLLLRGRGSGIGSAFMNASSGLSPTISDGAGLFAMTRTTSTNTRAFRNSTLLTSTNAISSTGVASGNVFAGARNQGGSPDEFSHVQMAAYILGGGMSDSEHNAIYSALSAYMTAVGAA